MNMESYWNEVKAKYEVMTMTECMEKFPEKAKQIFEYFEEWVEGEVAIAPCPDYSPSGTTSISSELYFWYYDVDSDELYNVNNNMMIWNY